MSQRSRPWFLLPVTLVLVVVVTLAQPGYDPIADPENRAAFELAPEEAAIAAELQATQQRVLGQIAVKELLIAQLIEGQHTLATVADEFLRLNCESDMCLAVVRDHFPGATDREKHAQNVISYALGRARSPDHKQVLQTRLEHEFEQHYGHGTP